MRKPSTVMALVALALCVAGATASAMEKVGNYLVPIEAGEFESSPMPTKCDVAIVGAGPGGIYSAYRMLSGFSAPPSVCVFEATNRVGGRIYTLRGVGKLGDMTVDLGAYRYIDGRHTLVQGLVENLLKLNYTLYDPASSTFRKIIDDKGDDLGFVTFVEELTKMVMEMGGSVVFHAKVTKVDRMPGMTQQYALTIEGPDGEVSKVVAGKVIFNTPQRPLFRILQNSNLVRITEFNAALNMPFPLIATKLYLYYDDAWWVYLNKTTGSLNDPNFGNATTYNDTNLFTTPPLRGRYHDGDWKCNAAGKCHGLFMFTYSADNGGTYNSGGQGLDITPYGGVVPRSYWNLAVNPDFTKPYVILDGASSTGWEIIKSAHDKLMAWHVTNGSPIPEPYASTYPTQVIIGMWDPQLEWSGGAWHSYKNGNRGGRVSTNYTDVREAVPVASIKPFADEEVYVANEAFSAVQGWAEGALIMAENVVTQLGAAAPTFISPERHACVVYDTYNYNASLCALSLNPIFQGTQRRLISLDDAATEVAATAAEAGSVGAVGGRRWRM